MRGAASDLDIFLVRAKLRQKINKENTSEKLHGEKYNLEQLENQKKAENSVETLSNNLVDINDEDDNIETRWQNINRNKRSR